MLSISMESSCYTVRVVIVIAIYSKAMFVQFVELDTFCGVEHWDLLCTGCRAKVLYGCYVAIIGGLCGWVGLGRVYG